MVVAQQVPQHTSARRLRADVDVAVMAEKGIDITSEQPKRWTSDMLEAVDVVVTMGCGDTCPILPGRRYEEWVLPDPAGLGVDDVRPIRDEIERRVHHLVGQLGVVPRDEGDASTAHA